ncbi:uncharacterized protein EI90DRAFT_3074127 [Cantharellus anzutake]|uniref:uncharacterized protein n=1 Tax=Cantharellus anzutake TaxID=1750568 RepID=UPI0019086CFF|nr:uncharacterized protein EI90DRAFT_3074127 [Cantharellus anzutake]KAF8324856.1 hypothetical protein EI90DRAFT_3074127 [Cantharellus anzutake]
MSRTLHTWICTLLPWWKTGEKVAVILMVHAVELGTGSIGLSNKYWDRETSPTFSR